jgi:uncharacterized protein (TIGR00725 family)
MKLQVGVMGSAGGDISEEELSLAHRLGCRIAERDCTIVTGACPGLPHAAVLGASKAGGVSLGISPALTREDHVETYHSPLQPYTSIVFTGSGLMGRETHNIHSSDFVIFIGGRSGTLGEFCIAYDEGKLIGILQHSGGVSDHLKAITHLVNKQTGATIVEDGEPERLVDRCLEVYQSGKLPTSFALSGLAGGARG